MHPRFTIVTPNFNMSGYLAETIESVLRNIGPDDEYFIVDGGSSDGSVDVIKQYADCITGWISEPDRSYADAIHKGFLRGSGRYQCWINAGDLLLSGALDTAALQLADTGADMIFGDDVYVDEQSRVLRYSRGYCPDLRAAMIYGGWTPLQDACFWRSELYCKVGGLDVSLRNAADYDLFARFSVHGLTCYVPFAFSAFRRHQGQRSLAHLRDYRAERATSRHAAIAASDDGSLTRILQRIRYFLAVRWRARVQHPRWNVPSLAGRPASELTCRQYWRS